MALIAKILFGSLRQVFTDLAQAAELVASELEAEASPTRFFSEALAVKARPARIFAGKLVSLSRSFGLAVPEPVTAAVAGLVEFHFRLLFTFGDWLVDGERFLGSRLVWRRIFTRDNNECHSKCDNCGPQEADQYPRSEASNVWCLLADGSLSRACLHLDD